MGSGKAQEIAQIVAANDADTIIVDDDLPPSQRRALEDATKVKVVDRTAVILDIFAQHATSREGKAQVELAQLQYMLPRLRGWGAALSRQAGGRAAGADGGIGSRGPGETKIEMDRRVIRTRIARLRRQIAQMAPAREVKRGSRKRYALPTISVVGYTNAGKSSLTNRLTGSDELVENALFATLDTAVRRARAKDGRFYAYVDTVGFVRRLPTQLVEAFKSTLEEIGESDVMVHVVDASHPDPFGQIDAVNEVLKTIDGVDRLPVVTVFNKVDLIDAVTRERLEQLAPGAFFVSSATGEAWTRCARTSRDAAGARRACGGAAAVHGRFARLADPRIRQCGRGGIPRHRHPSAGGRRRAARRADHGPSARGSCGLMRRRPCLHRRGRHTPPLYRIVNKLWSATVKMNEPWFRHKRIIYA